jgi:hypothetical protein
MDKRTDPTVRPFRMAQAEYELHVALVDLAHDNSSPRCTQIDGAMWTSEDVADRDAASALCLGCPVLGLCAAAADSRDERWGVWGGRDRGPRPYGAKSRRAGETS